MLALIQRVSAAKVEVGGETVAQIDQGLLAFLGIEKHDAEAQAEKLLRKTLAYRIFPDAEGKMNLSLAEVSGGLLVVSQFTLAADTERGLRPSFSSAKPTEEAERLYNHFVQCAQAAHPKVSCGQFAANMQVSLVNDGPVTFLLRS